MRLIFIPGFGEDQEIFSRIAPHLPGKKLFIHNLDLLGATPSPTLTVINYARKLIEQHQITRQDVLIGHSMGGWIALAIKQLVGCPIVQIASWTDQSKVVSRFKKPEYAYWFVRRGWYFNRFTRQLVLWLGYRGQPSAQIFAQVFQNLIDSPREYLINQLRVILAPSGVSISVEPEIRIHSKRDTVVHFPDQPTTIVPGDHFNLVTHPQDVIAPIIAFLSSKSLY